ncbi:putative exosome-associated protein [Penicillium brasilianum]|uniref:Exosome complex protein n=1 Tax=Penicillium brasilianum TaxID=104259 RepID=A0A1S9RYU5_PENBI|nr:putative exosome-associated protein [Penicillium brasilianum]
MDAANLLPLLEQLDDNVDDLQDVLEPLLAGSLNKMSKNMPIMDKAKLHVLITYALEALIFSYLRLRGVQAKQHPVFREITRVKQYFDKIKALETEPEQRPMVLDKAAAGRFIKHSLAGNDKIDLERAEREARERARAQIKAAMLAKKAASMPVQDSAQTEAVSSAGPSTAQSSAEAHSSDEEMEADDAAEEFKTGEEFIQFDDDEKKKKNKKSKEDKTMHRSESGKTSSRKATKAERRQQKKDRRRKKEETRKAREAK